MYVLTALLTPQNLMFRLTSGAIYPLDALESINMLLPLRNAVFSEVSAIDFDVKIFLYERVTSETTYINKN